MSLVLSIGGHVFDLEIPDATILRELEQSFGTFASSESAQTRLSVTFTDEAPTQWKEQEPAPSAVRQPDGALVLSGLGYRAVLSSDGRVATLQCPRARYPIDTTMKHLVGDVFLRRRGIVVHGVCVNIGDRAALFTGPSGAGKSTLAKFCSQGELGLRVLADELVGIDLRSSEALAYGTPWNTGFAGSAIIEVVGLIAWDSTPHAEPCAPTEVLRVLASNVVGVDESAATRGGLFQSASQLLSRVPTVRLSFAQDQRVAEVVRNLLGR